MNMWRYPVGMRIPGRYRIDVETVLNKRRLKVADWRMSWTRTDDENKIDNKHNCTYESTWGAQWRVEAAAVAAAAATTTTKTTTPAASSSVVQQPGS